MVCKRKNSPYRATDKPSPYWIKVKNRRYSQAEGRAQLFEPELLVLPQANTTLLGLVYCILQFVDQAISDFSWAAAAQNSEP
jgi:hypothetical protein